MGSRVPTALSQGVVDDACNCEDIDTVSLEQLPELAFESDSTLEMAAPAGNDPYTNMPPLVRPTERRRTLDDMRRLDEEIRQRRALNPPAGHALRNTKSKYALTIAIRDVLTRWFAH